MEAFPMPDFLAQLCDLYKKFCQSDAILQHIQDNDFLAEYDEDASDCEYDSDGELIIQHVAEYPTVSTVTPISDPAPDWHEKQLRDNGTKKWKNSFDTIDTIKRAVFTGAGEVALGRFCDLSVAGFLFFDRNTEIVIKRDKNQVVLARFDTAARAPLNIHSSQILK